MNVFFLLRILIFEMLNFRPEVSKKEEKYSRFDEISLSRASSNDYRSSNFNFPLASSFSLYAHTLVTGDFNSGPKIRGN